MQGVQREREEKLARKLKEFLNRYVRGDKEGFICRAESEAKRLSDAGRELPTLPRCYCSNFAFRFNLTARLDNWFIRIVFAMD